MKYSYFPWQLCNAYFTKFRDRLSEVNPILNFNKLHAEMQANKTSFTTLMRLKQHTTLAIPNVSLQILRAQTDKNQV